MEKLRIKVDGKDEIIMADVKIGRGMYGATDSNIAERNCRILNITFSNEEPDNVLQNKITKIGNWSFLTSMVVGKYLQYIFMQSASQEDFNEFVKSAPVQSRELLIQAFNMSRLSIDNIDVLANLNKNKN